MNKGKNYEQFVALYHRYRSIPLEKIHKKLKSIKFPRRVKNTLTGFGNPTTCSLCLNTNENDCSDCHWVVGNGADCVRSKTYSLMVQAQTDIEIHNAFQLRAEEMKLLIFPEDLIQ